MWPKFCETMGFGRAGLYFWDELPGRLQLLGEAPGHYRSELQKSQPVPSLNHGTNRVIGHAL